MSVCARDLPRALEEQAVAELHDVRLVDRRDPLAAVARGVVERELARSASTPLGDDLQALDDARDDLVLEAGVEVLGVLADDHEIDVLKRLATPGRFRTGRRFA